MSQKNSFESPFFVFDKPVETRFRKKFRLFSKNIGKVYVLKNLFFSIKCSYGHVECSFNKLAKKIDKRPKTSCSMSENDEKFHLFPKTVFFQNDFIDTKNAVLTGRPNFSRSITGNDLKKGPQKMQKLFKSFFFKKFPWRGRKRLESPADFFADSSRNFSARY